MHIPGLRIFLINADLSASHMESLQMEAFLSGYELHCLLARTGSAIKNQVKQIFNSFEETMILINIDRELADISSYSEFIKTLSAEYGANYPEIGGDEEVECSYTKIGVIHTISPNKINRDAELDLENFYLNNVKPCAGFFTFDIHHEVNTRNLLNYLDSYEYLRGYRRHTIRLICGGAYERVCYHYEGAEMQYGLLDISISHFSIRLPEEVTPKLYTKIEHIQIYLKSAILRTDCVLTLIKKGRKPGNICVFTFLHSIEKSNHKCLEMQGLSNINKEKVSLVILKELQSQIDSIII